MRGDRVLEVRRVPDQGPAGPGRLPDESGDAGQAVLARRAFGARRSRSASLGAASRQRTSNISVAVRPDRSERIRSGAVETKPRACPSLVGIIPAPAPFAVRPVVARCLHAAEVGVLDGARPVGLTQVAAPTSRATTEEMPSAPMTRSAVMLRVAALSPITHPGDAAGVVTEQVQDPGLVQDLRACLDRGVDQDPVEQVPAGRVQRVDAGARADRDLHRLPLRRRGR